MQTRDAMYIIELKLGTANEALEQIRARGYADKYANAGKGVVLVGVGLSEEEKNIGDWVRE